jgi:hypothetical protein
VFQGTPSIRGFRLGDILNELASPDAFYGLCRDQRFDMMGA